MNQDDEKSNDVPSKVFVLITCFEKKIKHTIRQLKKIEAVTEISKTDGSYDLIVTLEAKTNEDLKKILTHQLRKIETIRSTLTLRLSTDMGVLG